MHRKPRNYAPFVWMALVFLSVLTALTVAACWPSRHPAPVHRAAPVSSVTHAATPRTDALAAQHWIKEQHQAWPRTPAPTHHAYKAIAAPVSVQPMVTAAPAPAPAPSPAPAPGILSFAQIEALWVQAGGPAAAQEQAATVAECESGGNSNAYNPSGATGLWQILGQVVPGNLYDPLVNAENAVSKYEASGDTWAQWVCQP